MDVTIQSDISAALAKLKQFTGITADLTSFWTDVFAPRFLADIQENFDTQGGLVGGWAPLSPGYAAWKAQRYGAHLGILELSLRLRGSLQWLGSDIGPEGIFRATPTSLEIGTSVPYGTFHQEGEGVPQREFLFLRDDPDYYGDMWQEWFTERRREAGLE